MTSQFVSAVIGVRRGTFESRGRCSAEVSATTWGKGRSAVLEISGDQAFALRIKPVLTRHGRCQLFRVRERFRNSFLKGLRAMMKSLKKISLVMAVAVLAVVGIVSVGARTRSEDQFDAAATYKSKCVACHGAKAEKKFDTAKSEDEQVQITLKGKKMEKPPNMPAFEEKGITADQAKALVAYMKSCRQ
jgi:mono/diheme cytochrome c family protein